MSWYFSPSLNNYVGKNMKILKALLPVALLVLLSGCVQQNIKLKPEFITNKGKSIVIANMQYNAPGYYKKGSQGLLDVAIANAANEHLIKHLNNIDISNYESISYDFEGILLSKGYNAIVNDKLLESNGFQDYKLNDNQDENDYPKKDFRSLKDSSNADYLMIVEIKASGVERPYYGFIPTGAPVGMFRVATSIVDLNTNKYVWFQETQTDVAIEGEWDQPTEFPNLTDAIRKAEVLSRADVISALKSQF